MDLLLKNGFIRPKKAGKKATKTKNGFDQILFVCFGTLTGHKHEFFVAKRLYWCSTNVYGIYNFKMVIFCPFQNGKMSVIAIFRRTENRKSSFYFVHLRRFTHKSVVGRGDFRRTTESRTLIPISNNEIQTFSKRTILIPLNL